MRHEISENEFEFVARQYASLLGSGYGDAKARDRLKEALGPDADKILDRVAQVNDEKPTGVVWKLADLASKNGGDPASASAAYVRALGDARLFALDWWRPIRTFLLYILFLLCFASLIAADFYVFVLPVFSQFSMQVGLHKGGVAGWVMSGGAWRLIVPLIVIAVLILFLAIALYWVRLRIAGLRPLPGMAKTAWIYGRSGWAYKTLLGLEYTSILYQGGVKSGDSISLAMTLTQQPQGKPPLAGKLLVNDCLGKAALLGTFDAELDWQRRMSWSRTQTRLELSRDRLVLFSRVVFYVLIGYMVTVLYLPVFSIATMFGR